MSEVPPPICISLTWAQEHYGLYIGLLRHSMSRRDRSPKTYQAPDGAGESKCVLWRHQQGACAEYAVSIFLGIPWTPLVDAFKKHGDVGGYEVRWTELEHGRLVIRPDDPPDRWYILVTGRAPEMNIHGSIRGHKAKQDRWLKNPNSRTPAWFVPQSELLRKGFLRKESKNNVQTD